MVASTANERSGWAHDKIASSNLNFEFKTIVLYFKSTDKLLIRRLITSIRQFDYVESCNDAVGYSSRFALMPYYLLFVVKS